MVWHQLFVSHTHTCMHVSSASIESPLMFAAFVSTNYLLIHVSILGYGTGCSPHCCRVSALHITDLQVCFWSSPWRCVLVHRWHRLDHRPLLHHLRPPCKRRHKCPGESEADFLPFKTRFSKEIPHGSMEVFVILHRDACVCFVSSLKVFQSILMSAGSGRLLRSIKWPSSTQLQQPSACWWSTDGNRCRSKSLHALNVAAAQKNSDFPDFQTTAWPESCSSFPAFIWKITLLILKDLLLCSGILCNTLLSGEVENPKCMNNDESDTVWTCIFHAFSNSIWG